MPNFAVGAAAGKLKSDPFAHMSLEERKMLCMEVLNDIGARNITEKGKYEIYHSCALPFGNHPNGDRNPSASVNYSKMVAGCYVCGNGGWLWWIAAVKGLESSMLARDWVVKHAGEGRIDSGEDLLAFLDALYQPTPNYEPPIPTYEMNVLDQYMLVHPYMTEYRHVPIENIVRHKVGYGTFSIHLGDGHFKQSDRILIPHVYGGKLMGWQTRRLFDDDTPKYNSTPDMPKDTTLFGFDAHEAGQDLVVVESPMTVVRHSHNGPVTATFGASVTTKQREILVASKARRVIIWMDNDTAGWNATESIGEELMTSITPWVVDNPIKGDPGDLTDEQFRIVLRNCVIPYALWQKPESDEGMLDKEASDEEVRRRTGDLG